VPGEEIILAIATKEPTDFKEAEGAQEFIGKSVAPRLKGQDKATWATSEVRFYTEEPRGPQMGKYVYIPASPFGGGAKGLELPVGKGFDVIAVRRYEDGLRAQLLGRPEEAEEALKEALQIEPNFAQAHDALGTVYFSMGLEEPTRLVEAVREFQETLKDAPKYSLAHYNLGVTYFAEGDNAKAIESLNTFISLSPPGETSDKARTLLAELSPPVPPTG
jgi:tetratricopeptide (TPR) repeat protein